MQATRFLLPFLLIFYALSTEAKCTVPVPDGMELAVSSRNLAGHLVETQHRQIFVKKYGENKIVAIRLAGLENAYSAFGGDEKIHKLNVGVAVRVWYERCKNSAHPKAAYIEYFSNNSLDQPDASYFETKGR